MRCSLRRQPAPTATVCATMSGVSGCQTTTAHKTQQQWCWHLWLLPCDKNLWDTTKCFRLHLPSHCGHTSEEDTFQPGMPVFPSTTSHVLPTFVSVPQSHLFILHCGHSEVPSTPIIMVQDSTHQCGTFYISNIKVLVRLGVINILIAAQDNYEAALCSSSNAPQCH